MLQTGHSVCDLPKHDCAHKKRHNSGDIFGSFYLSPGPETNTLTLDTIDGSLERDKWLALSSRGICVSASVLNVEC